MNEGRFTEQILNRTGSRPFGFLGEFMWKGDTKDHGNIRYDKVKLFRTPDGYVMGVVRITCMEGERDFYQTRKFKGKEAREAMLTFAKKRLPYLEEQIKIVVEKKEQEIC